MPIKKKTEKRVKKENYYERIQEQAQKYSNCLFVNADNVSSLQISKLRARLRNIGAYMIMGKNTLMKSALTHANTKPEPDDEDYESRKDNWAFSPSIEKIIGQLRGNTNLIFTNGDLAEVKTILDSEVRESPAKAGMIAPKDVSVPVGPTGLDPKQTNFFQTLQIQTKIVKGQIDIIAEKQVIFVDTKVDSTQAALLDKLKIYPFEYKMKVTKILQNENLFDAAVLDLSTELILAKFKKAIGYQTAIALECGTPTVSSAPHSLLNGFKNLIAASCMSGYEFDQATAFLSAAASAPRAGGGGAAAAAAPKEEKQEKEEEEDVDMGGLFGDDDEY
jgi:large subunit ribosomal protein LP0